MEQPDTTTESVSVLDDNVYTLLLGSQRRKVKVLAHILTQIPYFAGLIKDGRIEHDTPYDMEDHSLSGVCAVLSFVQKGRVPDMSGKIDDPERIKHEITQHVKAYVYTLYFDFEVAQNAIIDSICPALSKASPSDLSFVFESETPAENFHDSQLFWLLSRQVTYLFQKQEKQSYPDLFNGIGKVVRCWEKEGMVAVIGHLLLHYKDESPVEAAMEAPFDSTNTSKQSRVPPKPKSKRGVRRRSIPLPTHQPKQVIRHHQRPQHRSPPHLKALPHELRPLSDDWQK